MTKTLRVVILILMLLSCHQVMAKKTIPALLDSVFCVADEQGRKVWHVESDYYFKGTQNLKRKNFLVRFASSSGELRKTRSLLSELTGHMTLIGKDYFHTKSQMRFDAVPNANTAVGKNVQYLRFSIYDAFMLDKQLLSPLCRCNRRYYRYSIDSTSTDGFVFVRFTPKHKHQQLVSGNFTFNRQKRYVSYISMEGDNTMTKFSYEATMGTQGEERFWPLKIELSYRYRYYGNIIEGRSSFYQRYALIVPHYEFDKNIRNKNDLSHLYNQSEDTTRVTTDSLSIASLRPVAISMNDQKIYEETYALHRSDNIASSEVAANTKPMKKFTNALETVAGTIFESNDITLNRNTTLEFSHLDVNYSGSRGVTLREDIELSHISKTGKRFSVTPNLGYYFRPKQFVWDIRTEYEYLPLLFGRLSLNIGSQAITNSTDRLRSVETGQMLENEEDAQSIVFNERFAEIYHSIEPVNGLSFILGAIYRQRSPHRMTQKEREALRMSNYYNSFVPRIAVTYTPGMKYYIKNGRKYLLGSKYPTFTIDLERAVKRTFNTDSHYEKWETEASQVLRVTPTNYFVWKAGYGMFTNSSEVNFIGYRNFNNGVVDYNWRDQRSGVFQLLDGKYYYNSPHYFRMHFVYESPALLLTFFNQRHVKSERIYSNTLFTEGLAPYVELGYGFSTIYFDFGFFASYTKKQNFKNAVKFSWHL